MSVLAQGVLDGPRDRLQHAVAGGVAVRVVELLEVVDVDHEDAQRLLVAQASLDLLAGAVHEEAPVVEACEVVGDHLAADGVVLVGVA